VRDFPCVSPPALSPEIADGAGPCLRQQQARVAPTTTDAPGAPDASPVHPADDAIRDQQDDPPETTRLSPMEGRTSPGDHQRPDRWEPKNRVFPKAAHQSLDRQLTHLSLTVIPNDVVGNDSLWSALDMFELPWLNPCPQSAEEWRARLHSALLRTFDLDREAEFRLARWVAGHDMTSDVALYQLSEILSASLVVFLPTEEDILDHCEVFCTSDESETTILMQLTNADGQGRVNCFQLVMPETQQLHPTIQHTVQELREYSLQLGPWHLGSSSQKDSVGSQLSQHAVQQCSGSSESLPEVRTALPGLQQQQLDWRATMCSDSMEVRTADSPRAPAESAHKSPHQGQRQQQLDRNAVMCNDSQESRIADGPRSSDAREHAPLPMQATAHQLPQQREQQQQQQQQQQLNQTLQQMQFKNQMQPQQQTEQQMSFLGQQKFLGQEQQGHQQTPHQMHQQGQDLSSDHDKRSQPPSLLPPQIVPSNVAGFLPTGPVQPLSQNNSSNQQLLNHHMIKSEAKPNEMPAPISRTPSSNPPSPRGKAIGTPSSPAGKRVGPPSRRPSRASRVPSLPAPPSVDMMTCCVQLQAPRGEPPGSVTKALEAFGVVVKAEQAANAPPDKEKRPIKRLKSSEEGEKDDDDEDHEEPEDKPAVGQSPIERHKLLAWRPPCNLKINMDIFKSKDGVSHCVNVKGAKSWQEFEEATKQLCEAVEKLTPTVKICQVQQRVALTKSSFHIGHTIDLSTLVFPEDFAEICLRKKRGAAATGDSAKNAKTNGGLVLKLKRWNAKVMLHGNGRGDMWWPTSDVGKMTEAYHELATYFRENEHAANAQDSPQQSEGHESISRCSSGAMSEKGFAAPQAQGMTRPPSHPGTHQQAMMQQQQQQQPGNNSMGPPVGYAMS